MLLCVKALMMTFPQGSIYFYITIKLKQFIYFPCYIECILHTQDEKGNQSPFCGNLFLYSRLHYVEAAVIITAVPVRFRKSECSLKVLSVRAAANAQRTIQPRRSTEEETALMFTSACHASFLLLYNSHVCQVLLTHNVTQHWTIEA